MKRTEVFEFQEIGYTWVSDPVPLFSKGRAPCGDQEKNCNPDHHYVKRIKYRNFKARYDFGGCAKVKPDRE